MATSATVSELRQNLDNFLDELNDRMGTHDLERLLLTDDTSLTGRDLSRPGGEMAGYEPEDWTERNLIWLMLDAVGLEWEPRPYGTDNDRPDFELTNLDIPVIGENKSPNKIDDATAELKDYLKNKGIKPNHGIATDGIEWVVYKIELGSDFLEYPEIARHDLRGVLHTLAAEKGYVSGRLDAVNVDAELEAFASTFERDSFNQILTQEAPQRFRDQRKKGVEDFYELYIELLFGKGSKYDYGTTLMDDIIPPSDDTPEKHIRLFGIALVNRLLFIKFLEDKGVIPDGLLLTRLRKYRHNKDDLAGGLYETQIKPLFYNLFNTPPEDRHPKYSTGWFTDVHYLNGGLFRETIPNERQYTVLDRILPDVIEDLIEGHELENNGEGLDPSIIGSVFEKTITHLQVEREQKDIGAYYTPNDVTSLVTSQAVDPKIKDEIVDTYTDRFAGTEEEATRIRTYIEDQLTLEDILRKIEDREDSVLIQDDEQLRIAFGDEEAIQESLERLQDLKVLDPACGSGHFLTTAMSEIHLAQLSLMRGLNGGDRPDPEDVFEKKKELALDAIYGVDAEPVGVEIAKLRVWLKIIEDGWEPSFGRLPNIDVNIASGNSLIGLPLKGETIATLDLPDVSEQIAKVMERRKRYKYENEGDKLEIHQYIESEIIPDLNRAYVDQLNHTIETQVTSPAEFEDLIRSIDDDRLYPQLQSIQVKRSDRDDLEDDEVDRLEEMGFSTYTKSARLDIDSRESDLGRQYESEEYQADEIEDAKQVITQELLALLEDDYDFTEVKRRPLMYDLDDMFGEPFHWPAEFPEVAQFDDNGHSVDFDIILGNPPYGDILRGGEKALVSTYSTESINDISAQFVERQLQLLDDQAYFGNVTTLRLVYQSTLHDLHDLIRAQLETTRIACFAKRPSHIFDNAQVRVAIITGKISDTGGDILTSDFIRFDSDDRDQRLSDVSYRNTSGYILGDKIGQPDDSYAILPKIGKDVIETILGHLKDASDLVFEDVIDRDNATEWDVWRMRHPDNWINPMLEEMYDAQDLEPMYFDTELERDSAFLIMSSSLFYSYWMVYGNQRDLNWGQLEAFPFLPTEDLEPHAEEIHDLADSLWSGMVDQFTTDPNPHYESMSDLKPLINQADELFGELYGLDDEQIEFLKTYHGEYGRSGPENEQLVTL